MGLFRTFVVEEEGTEAAEWALMVVVLALAILAGGGALTSSLGQALGNVGKQVDTKVVNSIQ